MDKSMLELPSKLETTRLTIRKYEKGDGKDLFRLLETNNNREFLIEHIDEAIIVKTEKDAESRIKELSNDWINRSRFVMGIWMKSSGKYIGQIWIEPNKWEVPSFELGWFLDRTHQGKGIATEASKAAIRLLFENFDAHKIIVITRDDNIPSSRLAERLGFNKEGHLREHIVKKDGSRVGLIYYGMLKKEWLQSSLNI
ncbi:MAG: GNAT family N-acetyltransferase [Candidatus Thorarchaeota archaeon]